MSDGRIASLEAEEEPGTVYFRRSNAQGKNKVEFDEPFKLTDWAFRVVIEAA
jgi:hypothetical protein